MTLALHEPAPLIERSTFDVMPLALQLADQLAMTDFVPKGLRGNKPAIMAAILSGHEIGLPPMAALANVEIIDGRPNLRAQAQRALILSLGHELGFVETTTTRCVMWGRRKGGAQATEVTYTMDDARRAEIAHKIAYKKNPQDMLIARATGRLARAIFPDVVLGIPYNREEVEDGLAADEQTPAGADSPPAGTRRRRASRAATQAPQSPPPPPEPPDTSSPAPASPPAPEPPPEPPDPSQVPASEPPPDQSMPLNQQLAMVCRELGIDRKVLIKALTDKERGSDLTREQAMHVLEIARAIQRGEMELQETDEGWRVIETAPPVEPELELDEPD